MFFNFGAYLANVRIANLPFLLVVKKTLPSDVNFLRFCVPTNSILSGMTPDVSLLSYATQVTSTEEYSMQFLFFGNGSHIPKLAEDIKWATEENAGAFQNIPYFSDLIIMV